MGTESMLRSVTKRDDSAEWLIADMSGGAYFAEGLRTTQLLPLEFAAASRDNPRAPNSPDLPMTDSTRGPDESLEWRWKPFPELTAVEVYDMLEARNAVFVVEQQCIYHDIDGLDKDAWHLFAYSHEPDPIASQTDEAEGAKNTSIEQAAKQAATQAPTLAGYLRVLLPDASDADIRIGRVLTTSAFRRIGLGSAMLEQALKHIVAQWPDAAIKLHAQAHLQMFYGAFGFEPISDIHDDDGIPHIWMRSV